MNDEFSRITLPLLLSAHSTATTTTPPPVLNSASALPVRTSTVTEPEVSRYSQDLACKGFSIHLS